MHTKWFALRLGLSAVLVAFGVLVTFGAPASAAVPGLQVVSRSSPTNSLDKSATASCPTGKRLIGAGGQLNAPSGKVILDEITPFGDNVLAEGFETDGGTQANWTVVAYAICANTGAVPGLQVVQAFSASTSSNKSATASCPTGKSLIGGAGGVNNAASRVILDEITLTGNSVVTAGVETDGGTLLNWNMEAYAFCANTGSVPGLQLVTVSSATNSVDKSATANCPTGKVRIGTGGQLNAPSGKVILDEITPAGQSVIAVGVETDGGTTVNWTVNAFAVCAST